MSPTSRKLLSRLYGDLAELRDAPYPGVSIFVNDVDVRKLCLVLTPPSGPWKDLSLHFDVQIPESWPASPPRIKSSVWGIDHPNLFDSYICCDLLKQREEIYFSYGYDGGYTPALTLRGLFLQFLTFFSSTKVEQHGGYEIDIGDHAQRKFVLEKNLHVIIEDINLGASYPLSRYGVSHIPQDDEAQAALAKAWYADRALELELVRYQGANGVILHKTKHLASHPERIHVLESESQRRKRTRRLLKKTAWRCKSCPYGSAELPHDNTWSKKDTQARDAGRFYPLDLVFNSHAGNSFRRLSLSYPRFRRVVGSTHELLRREVTCVFLRTSLRDSVLGIGVALNPGARVLSSDFDWLSEEAFTKHGVRYSIRKNHFEFFLPLAFNRYHFDKAQPSIWRYLQNIDASLRLAEASVAKRTGRASFKTVAPSADTPENGHEAVRVVFQMMNNVVVSLMKSCDDVLSRLSRSDDGKGNILRASERAVYAYCHLFHLAICLARSSPVIFRDAEATIRRFAKDPVWRVKAEVPDMGELIVKLTLVLALAPSKGMNVSWESINGPILEEVVVRNVRWVLKEAPELAVMEQGRNDYRLALTFLSSKTSLRLVMFQIAFLNMFVSTYASDLSYLDDHYGFPHKHVPERMVEKIKEIYSVSSWSAFFQKVGFAKGVAFGGEMFTDMLRQAVRTSAQRSYHTSVEEWWLRRRREQLEENWEKEHGCPK
ncbi:hypothetical protein D9757_005539 [Collybiopsis confluens]|uniref:UBC core domain-containing protein n=1 Tax=Collybiopsis confluens TaxID=2823264 RepID=A0A8H5HLS0_9AGAR|nr:hypothetical protein D9757_005539 [Collybiopsis confluens]